MEDKPLQQSSFQLTANQQTMLIGQQLQPAEPLYNMIMSFSIAGPIDLDLFHWSFQKLIDSCDILRAFIPNKQLDQHPVFVVRKSYQYQSEFKDFSIEPDPHSSYAVWLEERKQRVFDLSDLLFDSVLIKLSERQYIWYLNQHHISTDAWSMTLLFDKMQSIYKNKLQNINDDIEPMPKFSDCVASEFKLRQSKRYKRALTYWQKFADSPTVPTRFYHPTPKNRLAKTTRCDCHFGLTRSQRLRVLAKTKFVALSEDLSVMQMFATLLFSYLHRISGNDKLAIGTPVHSRTSDELKQTAGPLINLYPLTTQVEQNDSFESLYQKVAKSNQELLIHAVSSSANELLSGAFDVVLNYIPSSFGKFSGLNTEVEWVHSGFGDRNHLLRLQISDFQQSGEFSLAFDLNDDVFNEDESAWVLTHFLTLSDALLDDLDRPIASVPLVESPALPYQNQDYSSATSSFTSVVDLIKQQVETYPHHIAIIDGDRKLSYQELWMQSASVASLLKANGVNSGDIVAIKLARSIEAIAAILGIVRCRATFLPLDQAHPTERIQFMLDDSDAKFIIMDGAEVLESPFSQSALSLDNLDDTVEFESPNILPSDAAYLIYTSGSTGNPKGVLIPHLGLANYAGWAKGYYLEGQQLDFALFSSLSFDLTITSIFVPLISAGKILVYRDTHNEGGLLIRNVIEDNQVDVIKLTPAHLALIQTLDYSTSKLKKLIVGGDDFKTELALNMSRFFAGNIDIFNEYGPTEATVACTVHKYQPDNDNEKSVPIGNPIANANIFILDAYKHQVPQGVIGEIYIGGDGLALGYLNQPEQTNERFIKNPYNSSETLYKTGDLGSFNRKAEIEYHGRIDQQIKIQGVRIETAEIESAMLKFDGITDSVVDLSEHLALDEHSEHAKNCVVCGLEANHPSAQLDETYTCRLCRIYQKQKQQALSYFRQEKDLEDWIAKIKSQAKFNPNSKQDSIMLLSGGKDSSYALCKLVDMGLTPLVFTLDNGFISEGAKANCKRLVERLGLELIEGKTPDMNDIFVDSLKRFSNVCNGCFKTIYTMSMKLAKERGIKVICTGLSRGQIFETRVAHLFQQGCFDSEEIDRRIIEARKAYHRTRDLVSNRLDVKVFEDDQIFEDIQYLDFYRYIDVTLDQMYDYLNNVAPWIRPSDTGRSTNCLINDAGIYVHKKERGFHNYSLPYSWDVRLGHKQRDAALEELDDEIDLQKVEDILQDIGYDSEEIHLDQTRKSNLIGYYVAPAEILKNSLQKHLGKTLPSEYIPNQFVWMSSLPLTKNGKVDRNALPRPRLSRRDVSVDYSPPRNDIELEIARLWQQILGVEEVGINDNFFDLGGDSIVNIQIVSAARSKGIEITPQQVFDFPTIRELANVVKNASEEVAEQGDVIGQVPLLPSQLRFLKSNPTNLNKFNQSVVLRYNDGINTDDLVNSFNLLISQHDVLKSSFKNQRGEWLQTIHPTGELDHLFCVEKEFSEKVTEQDIEKCKEELIGQLNVENAKLLAFANIKTSKEEANLLLIVIHHLVCDGISWWILLSDLNHILDSVIGNTSVTLPNKTSSIKHWANALRDLAKKSSIQKERKHWLNLNSIQSNVFKDPSDELPSNHEVVKPEVVKEVALEIEQAQTANLLFEIPKRLSVPIQTVLLTAFAQTVFSLTSTGDMKIDIESHGREDIDSKLNVLRTVGWFTSISPVMFNRSAIGFEGKDLNLGKQLLSETSYNGLSYGALGLYESSEFLFNYMGQWDKNIEGNSRFSFHSPITKSYDGSDSSYVIELNSMVFDDKLQLTFTYNSAVLSDAVSSQMMPSFKRHLDRLIEYALSGQKLGHTPSDFPSADIKQQDLDDLFDEFGEDE